jgi:hypothetical protein
VSPPSASGHPGDWAELTLVVLAPEDRASSLPEDTAGLPLEARVKGFLREDAQVGEAAAVETVLGRTVEGRLLAVLPEVPHSFGLPAPELLPIGQELRAILRSAKADD